MFKNFFALFKTKNSNDSEIGLNSANAEFDALMVTVENDRTDLAILERHVHHDLGEIEVCIKEDCEGVDRVMN